MKRKDFICLQDFTGNQILELLASAHELKADRQKLSSSLRGKTLGLVFQKPSNRTRVSFEVGVYQLGGNCIYLGPEEINLGIRETTEDVSRTLSRYLDAIVARTHKHQDILDLARFSTIPIINGLSDLFHPCQALADLFSIWEKYGRFKGLTLGYVGDGNNVAHSLLTGCSKVGMNMRAATPPGYEPLKEIVRMAEHNAKESGSRIMITHNPQEAVADVDVIYSDVWVSMGQEAESDQRLTDFHRFQVNEKLIQGAKKDCIFMHCLPAHRGQEVTDEVIDGPHSIVFDQAENRLHTQKAVLNCLMNS